MIIISFGSIPNSRNVLFLQIFLKRAGKPSSGNTSADFLWIKWAWPGVASATFSGTFSRTLLNLTWLCTKASRSLLRNFLQNPVEPDLALHQSLPEPSPEPSLPDLLRNLLRNPVEPDLALRQSLGFAPSLPGTLLNLTWLCTKASRSLLWNLLQNPVDLNQTWLYTKASRTFSGTLLNLTSLCTKASHCRPSPEPLRSLVEHDLALHQSLPDLLRNLFRNPVEHLPEPPPEPSPEPSPEPCWTWPGSAPKPPRPSLEHSPEPSPEPCLNLTFSGTLSRTTLNLTRRLHQCTPELFWAEDPLSVRCWGILDC